MLGKPMLWLNILTQEGEPRLWSRRGMGHSSQLSGEGRVDHIYHPLSNIKLYLSKIDCTGKGPNMIYYFSEGSGNEVLNRSSS